MKKLVEFPEVMEIALNVLEPQVVATYLQSLAGTFHKFYSECRVITDDRALTQARLALIGAVKIVLANGLTSILGVQAPKKM